MKSAVDGGDKSAAKKPGRPRKHAADDRRTTLTFRVGADLYERLAYVAKAAGRSLSEEVERRVESSMMIEAEFGTGEHLQFMRMLNGQLRFADRLFGGLDYGSSAGLIQIQSVINRMLDGFTALPVNASDDEKKTNEKFYDANYAYLQSVQERISTLLALNPADGTEARTMRIDEILDRLKAKSDQLTGDKAS